MCCKWISCCSSSFVCSLISTGKESVLACCPIPQQFFNRRTIKIHRTILSYLKMQELSFSRHSLLHMPSYWTSFPCTSLYAWVSLSSCRYCRLNCCGNAISFFYWSQAYPQRAFFFLSNQTKQTNKKLFCTWHFFQIRIAKMDVHRSRPFLRNHCREEISNDCTTKQN